MSNLATTGTPSTEKRVQFDSSIDWTEEFRRSALRRQKSQAKKEAKEKMDRDARSMYSLLMNPASQLAISAHANNARSESTMVFGWILFGFFNALRIASWNPEDHVPTDTALLEMRGRFPTFDDIPERGRRALRLMYQALVEEGAIEDGRLNPPPTVTPERSPPRNAN